MRLQTKQFFIHFIGDRIMKNIKLLMQDTFNWQFLKIISKIYLHELLFFKSRTCACVSPFRGPPTHKLIGPLTAKLLGHCPLLIFYSCLYVTSTCKPTWQEYNRLFSNKNEHSWIHVITVMHVSANTMDLIYYKKLFLTNDLYLSQRNSDANKFWLFESRIRLNHNWQWHKCNKKNSSRKF